MDDNRKCLTTDWRSGSIGCDVSRRGRGCGFVMACSDDNVLLYN